MRRIPGYTTTAVSSAFRCRGSWRNEAITIRAQILAALAAGPATTPDLAAATGRDRALVWLTLRRMQRAGLVEFRRFWTQQTAAVAWRLRGQ